MKMHSYFAAPVCFYCCMTSKHASQNHGFFCTWHVPSCTLSLKQEVVICHMLVFERRTHLDSFARLSCSQAVLGLRMSIPLNSTQLCCSLWLGLGRSLCSGLVDLSVNCIGGPMWLLKSLVQHQHLLCKGKVVLLLAGLLTIL